MRPLIGVICCTREPGDNPSQGVDERYLLAAPFMDADALLIPSGPIGVDAANVMRRLDGLLLTGSPSNVSPAHYGMSVAGVGPFDPARDATMLRLVDAATEQDKPMLGICRGFQEVAVAFGSTLRWDLGQPDRDLVHHVSDDFERLEDIFSIRHPVELTEDGLLQTVVGARRIDVTSAHYQGVERLGPSLVCEAISPDGVIEAVRPVDTNQRVLAVQWHPEWDTQNDPPSRALFRFFGALLRGASMPDAARQARGG